MRELSAEPSRLWSAKRRIFASCRICSTNRSLRTPRYSGKMVSFPALNKPKGLKAVDEHLLTRSYITG